MKHPNDHYPDTANEADRLARRGVPLIRIRTPEGTINNCSLSNGDSEHDCQICSGNCPDRSDFE